MKIKQRGFTIVELLIVIVVIGILAAIVIVAFNGVQNRANNTAIQNDIKNISKKLELVRIDSTTSTYPTSLNAATGIAASKNAYDTTQNNFYYCLNQTTNAIAIGARSKSKNGGYVISSTNNTPTEVSAITGEIVCNQVGTSWNGANTVNYVGYNGTTMQWEAWVNG